MDQEMSLQEILTLAMITLTSAAKEDTLEKLTETSTRETESLLADKELQKHIGVWDLVWGPVIYAHSEAEKVVADNSMFIVKQEQGPQAVRYVVSIMGTNPISEYGWFTEDFGVDKTVPWAAVLKAGDTSDTKGVISEGTCTGLNILTNKMEYNNQSLRDFLKQAVKEPGKEYHIYVTGHSLGGPLAVTTALWLHETRGEWAGSSNPVIHVYPFAGATAGDRTFASYAESLRGDNFLFPRRYWNQYDIVPHVWYAETIAEIPTLYEPQIPPTPLVEGLVKWAQDHSKNTAYYHINQDTGPLEEGPESLQEKFLEAVIKGSAKSLVKLLDSFVAEDENLKNSLNFVLRVAWEHSIAYFELLNMLNILVIMITNLIFAEALAGLMTDSLFSSLKKFFPRDTGLEKVAPVEVKKLIQEELKKLAG